MLIVFRWWYFVGIAGLVLAALGVRETSLAMKAAKEPEDIRLVALENGERPSQPFVRIDAHYAVYGACSYESKRDRIKSTVYPIVSAEHPWSKGWDALNAKYENPDDIPRGEMPPLEPLQVLVKTSQFDRLEDIPDGGEDCGPISGVLFTYDELDSDEQELVRMVSDKANGAVLLDLGRKPTSLAASAGMLAIGLILCGLAVRLFFRRRREPDPRDEEPAPEPEAQAVDREQR